MKFLKIAVAAVCLLTAPFPVVAQSTGSEGYQFVDAVRGGDGDKAMQLFQSSGPRIVDARDSNGNTALIAALNNVDDRFTSFLLSKGADPDLPGQGGDTPLITAAKKNYTDAIGWLLGLGAKVNTANRRGETPLIIAVQLREPRIVRLLLEAGADPDKTDSVAGFSARDYASRDTRSREIQQMIQSAKKSG